jgi:predicted alpha/beta-hydrolase family hydrolase
MTEPVNITTPHGRARLTLHRVRTPRALLLLGHGAGGGITALDLLAVTAVANELGVSVGLVEQPYRVAGRRSPAPARQLDTAWLAVVETVRATELSAPDGPPALPLLVGGRSSGARVACRTAVAAGAAAVICLAFPLHPPGQPEKSRQSELDGVPASLPTLVVQGEKDPFGMPPAAPGREVVVVAGNHSLATPDPVRDAVGPWLAIWLAVAARPV